MSVMFVFCHACERQLRFGAVPAGRFAATEALFARNPCPRAPFLLLRRCGVFAGKALPVRYRTGHPKQPDSGRRKKRYSRRLARFPLSAPSVLSFSSSVFAALFFRILLPGRNRRTFFTPLAISASPYKVTPQFSNELILCVLTGKMRLRR